MAVPVRAHVRPDVVERYLAGGAYGRSGVGRTSHGQAWVVAAQHYGASRRDAVLDLWQDAVEHDRGRLEVSNPEPSIASGSQIDSQKPGGQFDSTPGAPRGRIEADTGGPAIIPESLVGLIDVRRPAPDQRCLYHQQEQRRGTMWIGGDADLLVWDADTKLTISQETLNHASDYVLYEDYRVLGLPSTVTLRGEVLVQDREFVSEPGKGSSCAGTIRVPEGARRGSGDNGRRLKSNGR